MRSLGWTWGGGRCPAHLPPPLSARPAVFLGLLRACQLVAQDSLAPARHADLALASITVGHVSFRGPNDGCSDAEPLSYSLLQDVHGYPKDIAHTGVAKSVNSHLL